MKLKLEDRALWEFSHQFATYVIQSKYPPPCGLEARLKKLRKLKTQPSLRTAQQLETTLERAVTLCRQIANSKSYTDHRTIDCDPLGGELAIRIYRDRSKKRIEKLGELFQELSSVEFPESRSETIGSLAKTTYLGLQDFITRPLPSSVRVIWQCDHGHRQGGFRYLEVIIKDVHLTDPSDLSTKYFGSFDLQIDARHCVRCFESLVWKLEDFLDRAVQFTSTSNTCYANFVGAISRHPLMLGERFNLSDRNRERLQLLLEEGKLGEVLRYLTDQVITPSPENMLPQALTGFEAWV
jgi:hypothetical protein